MFHQMKIFDFDSAVERRRFRRAVGFFNALMCAKNISFLGRHNPHISHFLMQEDK